MPFYLLHAGTTLQKMDVYGNLSTITLPAGVTMVDTRRARFAILNRTIFVANAVSVNVIVNDTLLAYFAVPTAPTAAPSAAAGAGALIGDYFAAYSYAIKKNGKIVAESDISPISTPVTLATAGLSLTGITVSAQAGVNCRRVYRTASGGDALYFSHDIDDNVTTTYTTAEEDAALGSVSVVEAGLGPPPGTTTADRLKLLVAWKDRLWGVSDLEPDNLRYSGARMPYAWSGFQMLPVPQVGNDAVGVNGFLPRRDELGVGKLDVLWKVIGSSGDDFRMVKVIEGTGIIAPDSCVVIRDIGYFLGQDGVYTWGPEGVENITDDTVRPWFTTDLYFNRARFAMAYAWYNERVHSFMLHLAALGSSVEDRWVQYDIRRKRWFGPHKTGAFTPTCGGIINDANDLHLSVVGGSNGYFYLQHQAGFNDDTTPIDFDVITQPYVENAPDAHKLFKEASVINKAQAAGNLTVTATIDAVTQAAMTAPLTTNRTRLRRLGAGRLLTMRFQHSTAAQGCEIYGFEVPFHILGRR